MLRLGSDMFEATVKDMLKHPRCLGCIQSCINSSITESSGST